MKGRCIIGWDAFATRDGEILKHGNPKEGWRLLDAELDQAFQQVAEEVKAATGTADGLLANGGLDCGICAKAIEVATGSSCWDPKGWTPEEVTTVFGAWVHKKVDSYEPWARESAYKFLAVCVRFNLGVHFSW